MNTMNVDAKKVAEYQSQLEEYTQKFKDKKSELQWADDKFEASVIEQEMQTYAKKIKNLKKILVEFENHQQVA